MKTTAIGWRSIMAMHMILGSQKSCLIFKNNLELMLGDRLLY